MEKTAKVVKCCDCGGEIGAAPNMRYGVTLANGTVYDSGLCSTCFQKEYWQNDRLVYKTMRAMALEIMGIEKTKTPFKR